MPGVLEIPCIAHFHDLPGVHDEHAITEGRHQAQIMADEYEPHAVLGHHVVEDCQHLELNRHVQRRCRLVGDDDVGLRDHHHGDHDALTHAAGDLVRIGMVDLSRIADAHRLQHLQGALAGFLPGGLRMYEVGLLDLLADGDHRVQRILRILHDHRDTVATDGA